MPSMPGPMELLMIGAIALIVFGPHRLPQLARTVGKAVNEFRRQAADLKAEFNYNLDEEDDTPSHYPAPEPESEDEAEDEPEPTAETAPDETA